MSHSSSPSTTPSGRNERACQMALDNSFTLPATSISFASFMGSEAICALPGLSSMAHSFAAFCPGSSLSKQKTTVSNFSSQSISLRTYLAALSAPLGTLTTGHELLVI